MLGDCHLVVKQYCNTFDTHFLEYPLSQTFIISNFFFGPFSTLGNFPYKFVRYFEPRYLELSLCLTLSSVSECFLGLLFRTFSFISFECLNSTFENFYPMFIFSYFNTKTCWKQSSILTFLKEKIKINEVFTFSPLLSLNYLPFVL